MKMVPFGGNTSLLLVPAASPEILVCPVRAKWGQIWQKKVTPLSYILKAKIIRMDLKVCRGGDLPKYSRSYEVCKCWLQHLTQVL